MNFLPLSKDKIYSKQGNLKFYGYFDKLEHAFFYVPIVFIVMYYFFSRTFSLDYITNVALVSTLTFALGLIKELCDGTEYAKNAKGLLQGNGFRWVDLLFDVIGLVVVVFLFSKMIALVIIGIGICLMVSYYVIRSYATAS